VHSKYNELFHSKVYFFHIPELYLINFRIPIKVWEWIERTLSFYCHDFVLVGFVKHCCLHRPKCYAIYIFTPKWCYLSTTKLNIGSIRYFSGVVFGVIYRVHSSYYLYITYKLLKLNYCSEINVFASRQKSYDHPKIIWPRESCPPAR